MDIHEIFGESRRPVSLPNKSAIYVWGYNHSGQTGRRDKERSLRIPKQLPPELFGCPAGGNSRWLDIACGREHTAAVASDGSLFTWGLKFLAFTSFIFNIHLLFCLFGVAFLDWSLTKFTQILVFFRQVQFLFLVTTSNVCIFCVFSWHELGGIKKEKHSL